MTKISDVEANLEQFKSETLASQEETRNLCGRMRESIDRNKVEADKQFAEIMQQFKVLVLSDIHASVPPRGWNSYDSFCWTISEEEYLQNAQLISQKLHAHGYEYAVVDYLWYRKLVPGAYVDSLGYDVIDEWGRVIPDPGRWPSSKGGKGFKEVAKKVHDMGLKFGFHIMRGISTQAVNANTPILDITTGKAYVESGKVWHAKDIGITERACGWMKNGFMSVDTKLGAGRAFLKSLYHQYAEWDVDFLKHDCVFGDDFELEEINEVIRAPHYQGKASCTHVNMYRVTGDDWDNWGDVASHFAVSRDFAAASMIGGSGLLGNSWPDLDMLPLGWLTEAGANVGPHRNSSLTLDEQKTQFPYVTSAPQFQFLEGRLKFQQSSKYADESRKTHFRLATVTNPRPKATKIDEMWELSNNGTLVNSYSGSCASIKVMKANAVPGGIRSWIATGRRGEVYLAYFNLTPTRTVISTDCIGASKSFPAINFWTCSFKEIWSEKTMNPTTFTLASVRITTAVHLSY
ncbi:melibiase family protein [Tanacetum coccineum]